MQFSYVQLRIESFWDDCSQVADLLGLEKGTDWEPVCLGELGFGPLIDDLAREDWNRPSNASDTLSSHHPPGDHLCDIGVSAITANSERWRRGIQFSRATLRSNLAIMVHAPLLERGKWAFFAPLALSAWAMLAATTMVVPMFVFFFEAVFSSQCDSSIYYFPSVFRVLMGRRALYVAQPCSECCHTDSEEHCMRTSWSSYSRHMLGLPPSGKENKE